MELLEIFQVLGIEETKDERLIKNAYREKLSVTNPEDNPEGFKRLRTAYEEACAYARQSGEEEEERDATPSGLWVEKAADIYGNINTRQDVQKWKELFEEDIFLSLEEEENCRLKLLRFIMDHFKMPTDVWKLLDEKLDIVPKAAELRERFPVDFVHYIVSKCERGEDVEFGQFEGEPDAAYDLFLQYYDRCWNALQDKQFEQMAEYIKNADELHIFHPVMEVCRAYLAVEQGKLEEAVESMEKLRERYPEDAMVCYNAAEIMWRHDKKERAAKVYEGLKEQNDTHYMANVRLTEWYYEQGRYEDAKKCAEKVLSSGADDDFMELLARVNQEIEKGLEEHYRREKDSHSALELGWCYLQDGKISQGIRLVESLRGEVPEDRDSEYKGLLTKLYMEETEYEKASAMADRWERALLKRLESDEPEEEKKKDQDRVRQYHMIKMQCYRAFGDMRDEEDKENKGRRQQYERAIAEAEKLLDGTSYDIGLLLEQAQIYMEMEEYEKSLELTERLVQEHQVYVAAYATELEVYRRQWNASGVVQAGRQCINYMPNYIRSYEHIAKVFLDLERYDDLEQLLAEAKENGNESVILDAYRYQMTHKVPETEELDKKLAAFRKEYFTRVEAGNMDAYEKGLPILTNYLYWYPGTYMLVERGLFHRAAHHYEEAKADFEKALAENPRQPYALNGLSFVYKYQGDYEKALIYLKRANRYRDPDMSDIIYADMANLYSLLGNHKEALKAYKKFADKTGYGNQYHMSRLAMCMARCGEIDQAVQVLTKAYEDERLERYDEVADIYQLAGRDIKAECLLEEWRGELFQNSSSKTTGHEYYAKYYIRMAWQEVLFKDGARAVEYYETALKYREHATARSICGTLCDAIFICILCGDGDKGREFAARLRLYQNKEKSEGGNIYLEQDKLKAQMEFLAAYYKEPWDAEEAGRLLEKGDGSEICRFCSYCVCKELEAAHILRLLRMGKEEEATGRLLRNLEKQALDEYMLAIRHMCMRGDAEILRLPEKSVSAGGNNDNKKDKAENINFGKQKTAANKNAGFMAKLKGLLGRDKE